MATITSLTKVNMLTTSAVLDGTQFNSIPKSGFNSDAPYVWANTPWSTLDTTTSMKYAVNAVDIDWNDANL